MRAFLAALLLAALVGAAPAAGDTAPPRDELDGRLQAVVDGLTRDVFVGAGLSGEPEAFYVPGAALTVSLPGDATRTYVSGLANVGVGDIVHGDIWGYTSASYYVEGPAPYGGVVVANTTNLFPSPVGDLGVLRGALQAIGGM